MHAIRPSLFKRALALLIDVVLLSLIGLVLGLFLEHQFVALGKYGILVGSTIAVLYFGSMQSRLGKGQSLGKRAIGARVVGLNGQYLSFGQSLLRAFVLFFSGHECRVVFLPVEHLLFPDPGGAAGAHYVVSGHRK